MWFFDSVLEETPKTGTVSSPITKDEQDGSFLIIDDSVSAESIPDTALQLFDATPVATINAQETALVSEVSFFSEPAVSQVESPEVVSEAIKSSSPEVAFFDALVESAETDTVVEMNVENVEENNMTSSVEEPVIEPIQENIPVYSTMEENDIYAPMKRAITEYDTLLASRTQIADAIDNKIAERNARIAEEKAAAKKDLEERKALETGTAQIQQMRDILSAQVK